MHPFFLQGTIRGSLLPSFKTPKNSVSRSWYGAGTERVRSRSFSKSDRTRRLKSSVALVS